MEYVVAFSPDLELKITDFVQAWNEATECRKVGEAKVGDVQQIHYDPTLLASGVAIVGNVAASLAANVIYDLIKKALRKNHLSPAPEILQVDQPGGIRLLVIKKSAKS